MRNLIFSLVVLVATAVTGPINAQVLAFVALVPEHLWVEVKNPEPIHNGNNTFRFGETCSLGVGNLLTGFGSVEKKLLVRYSMPDTVFGTACPDGTIFLLSSSDFTRMNDRAVEVIRKMEAEAAPKAKP